MRETKCENCGGPLAESESSCPSCGYPVNGTKAEKIAYNGKLLRIRDQVEDSDKSIKGILSFSIIFMFMAFVVLLFSIVFDQNHYRNAFFFILCGLVYFSLYRLGNKSAYLMAILTLFFYVGHTIFEFSNGMFLKSPVGLDKSFLDSKGTSLFFAIIPVAYLIVRLSLMIVLAKYLWIKLKLKREEKMVRFIRSSNKK